VGIIMRIVGILFFVGLFFATSWVYYDQGQKTPLWAWSLLFPVLWIVKGWIAEATAEPSPWDKYEDKSKKSKAPTYHG
jgi:hypothetical protein